MHQAGREGGSGLPDPPFKMLILTWQTPGSAIFAFLLSTLLSTLLLISAPLGTTALSQSRPKVSAAEKLTNQQEAELLRAVRQSPASFQANHNLGEYYLRQKRLREAVPCLAKAREIDPSHYANTYDLALSLFLLEDYAAARRHLEEAITRFNRAELCSLLGEVEEKSGDVAAAALAYHRAAGLDPSENNILSLGNLLIKSSSFDQAIRFFDFGLEKYPGSAQLLVGKGLAEYSMGEYERGVTTLCRATDLAPTDPRPFLFLGEMAGVAPALADEIIRRMDIFVKYHPDLAKAHYYRAINLWRGRRDGDAKPPLAEIEQSLLRATRLDPRYPEPFYELGVFYVEKGDLAKSIANLQIAVRLKPDHTKAHFRLIQVYQRTGRLRLAEREKAIYERLRNEEEKKSGIRLTK